LVRHAVGGLTLEQCQPRFDMHVARIKIGGPCIRIKSVARLVVARLILCDVSMLARPKA